MLNNQYAKKLDCSLKIVQIEANFLGFFLSSHPILLDNIAVRFLHFVFNPV